MANRQEDNAKVLKNAGAAEIISNETVNYQNLSMTIDKLIEDKVLLNEMGKNAEKLAPKNVEDKIYEEIKKIKIVSQEKGEIMPRKRKTAKELREEQKRERLAKLTSKNDVHVIENLKDSEVHEEDLKENAKILDKEPTLTPKSIMEEENLFRKEKNFLQRELDSMNSPEILETPDFLINPSKEDERKKVFAKIDQLLKRRFSLVAIADILETNRYDKLDEIFENKEKMYKLVEKYTR